MLCFAVADLTARWCDTDHDAKWSAYTHQQDYLRMRRWLAGLLLLDGMLAVVWMLVLAYGYGLYVNTPLRLFPNTRTAKAHRIHECLRTEA